MGVSRPPAPCTWSCFWASQKAAKCMWCAWMQMPTKPMLWLNAGQPCFVAMVTLHFQTASHPGQSVRQPPRCHQLLQCRSTGDVRLRPRRRHPPHDLRFNHQAPTDSQPSPGLRASISTSALSPIQIKCGKLLAIRRITLIGLCSACHLKRGLHDSRISSEIGLLVGCKLNDVLGLF